MNFAKQTKKGKEKKMMLTLAAVLLKELEKIKRTKI